MPPEKELIKQQMDQTRAALSEKLETLETKVFSSVSSTVDIVTQTVQETGTTVRETVQSVRAAVRETLASMHDAFDLSRQVQHHPWFMLGSSILAGYIGGVLLDHHEQRRLASLPVLPKTEQLSSHHSEIRPPRKEAEVPARCPLSAFLKVLAGAFAPELEKLKAAAVGMALGVLRDKLSEAAPPQMREALTEMMDRFTMQLGGQPRPVAAVYRPDAEGDQNDGLRMTRPPHRD